MDSFLANLKDSFAFLASFFFKTVIGLVVKGVWEPWILELRKAKTAWKDNYKDDNEGKPGILKKRGG